MQSVPSSASAAPARSSCGAAKSESPKCPKCGGVRCSRVNRHGFMQRYVYAYFGRYPWECAGCREVFLVANRGSGKRKRETSGGISGE